MINVIEYKSCRKERRRKRGKKVKKLLEKNKKNLLTRSEQCDRIK